LPGHLVHLHDVAAAQLDRVYADASGSRLHKGFHQQRSLGASRATINIDWRTRRAVRRALHMQGS